MTIDEMISVLTAAKDGKAIQTKVTEGWVDAPNPKWCFDCCDYRIRPEPKVIWVNEYENSLSAHHTKERAMNYESGSTRVAVKYIEVTE